MAGNKGFHRNSVRNKQTKNNNKDKNTTYQNCPPSELIIEEFFFGKNKRLLQDSEPFNCEVFSVKRIRTISPRKELLIGNTVCM